MTNPIKEIVAFNQKAGLLDKPYDDFLESSFQIEEALENMYDLDNLYEVIAEFTYTPTNSPKDISRSIIFLANGGRSVSNTEAINPDISDVDRLDKACDSVVYAIGSMAKLGLTAQQIQQALLIVNKHNLAKLNCPKDEHGKLMKPEGFTGPEPELQLLLQKRSK